jgi:putative chitobiose transport system substrate-binding protein
MREMRRCMAVFFMLAAASNVFAKERIEFWTMQLSPFHDEYIKGVIADFERANLEIAVKWVDVPWAEMEKKTLASVAAASAKNPPPDVVNLNPQFASKLAEFSALADPEEFFSATEIAAYLPAAWNANKLDGKSFGIPWYLSTNILLYNKDVLARAGVLAPTTHEEMLIAAKRIREVTGNYAYFPALDGSTPLENLVAMGGKLTSADGCRAGFINPTGRMIFSYYRDLYQNNLVPKNVVTEGHRKSVEMFLSGQVAMVTTGMQFMQSIKNSNPGFYAKIGVAPQVGIGTSQANIAAMNVGVLSASSKKISAFKFAQFLTNAENQVAFAKRVPILPSTLASYQHPFFAEQGNDDSNDALINRAKQLSVQQVLEGKVLVPPMRKYSKFRSTYARNLQAVMLNRKSVDEAMQELDSNWAQLLGCAK